MCDHDPSDTIVIDTRPASDGRRSRRRECNQCHKTWSTVEIPLDEYQSLLIATNKAKPKAKNGTIKSLEMKIDRLTAYLCGVEKI